MAAFSNLFGLPVQRCSGACLENRALLCEAQHASSCRWFVMGNTGYDFPSDLEAFSIAFVTPGCL